MRGKRLIQTIHMCLLRSSRERANYLKNVFHSVGDGCTVMDRKIPLYPELISLGNNVHLASHVYLTTHDITDKMLNQHSDLSAYGIEKGFKFKEKIGCIEIGDNVFVGSGTRVLGNVKIGSNCIIGAGSLVNKDIPENCVVGGVPAKVIGKFDEYVRRRSLETEYPEGLEPGQENVSADLIDYKWKQFENFRSSK